jgi:hypothetical protein
VLLAAAFAFLAVGAVIGARRFGGGLGGVLLAALFALAAWGCLRAARRR